MRWFTRDELASADGVSEDSRIQGLEVLAIVRRQGGGGEARVPKLLRRG